MNLLGIIFGAKAQIAVGIAMVLATAAQTYYWVIVTKPTTDAVFYVSMEALLFAGYGVMATALGHRATERVEAHVDPHIDVDVDVDVER